jgi:hypothetical protein
MPRVIMIDGGVEEDITEHPDGRFVARRAAAYRAAGLAPEEFADDLPPDGQTGRGGIMHWSSDAEVADDWSVIRIEAAWASAGDNGGWV